MIKLLSLFSGIGAFEKALDNIGEPYELINYCEIDKYASKAYSLIHNVDESKNLRDVCSINPNELPRDIDLITYGFPCQDISFSGKRKGFVNDDGQLTRSGLFFKALEIIEKTQPRFAIAENVKALTSQRFKTEFEIVLNCLSNAGYINYYSVLNSKDYGIPQNRDRVFIISIRNDIDAIYQFPEPQELRLRLRDMLEEHVDEKYFLSKKMMNYVLAKGENDYFNNPEIDLDIARPILSSMHKSHRASCDNYVSDKFLIKEATTKGYAEAHEGDYINLQFPSSKTRRGRVGHQIANTLICNDGNGVVENLRIRKLTPKECFRLMGFDDRDCDILVENKISNTQLYKMAGNSIVVDVLEKIFLQLLRPSENPNQVTIFDVLNSIN